MKKIITVLLLFALACTAIAQQDTTAKTEAAIATAAAEDSIPPIPAIAKPKSYFLGSVGYLSNSVYNGRKDSVATPYITPFIGYYDKSGFFINGSMSWLARAGSSRIDIFNIEAGYDFYLGSFDGEIAANKSFYNSSSTNVQSEITGSLFASGGYDFDFIKPSIEGGINFGTKNDYMMSFGLEHTFYLLKDKLQITPTARGSGSTQNYYDFYYNKRKVGGKRKNAGVVYDVTAGVEDAARFKMLDYAFSLPVSYTVKKITLSFSPAYVLPVNPAIVTVTLVPETTGATRTKTSAEIISNTFYCSFGVSYKF